MKKKCLQITLLCVFLANLANAETNLLSISGKEFLAKNSKEHRQVKSILTSLQSFLPTKYRSDVTTRESGHYKLEDFMPDYLFKNLGKLFRFKGPNCLNSVIFAATHTSSFRHTYIDEWNAYKEQVCQEVNDVDGGLVAEIVDTNGYPVHVMMYLGHGMILHKPGEAALNPLEFASVSAYIEDFGSSLDCFYQSEECYNFSVRFYKCDPNTVIERIPLQDQLEKEIAVGISSKTRLNRSHSEYFSLLSDIKDSSSNPLIIEKSESLRFQLNFIPEVNSPFGPY